MNLCIFPVVSQGAFAHTRAMLKEKTLTRYIGNFKLTERQEDKKFFFLEFFNVFDVGFYKAKNSYLESCSLERKIKKACQSYKLAR